MEDREQRARSARRWWVYTHPTCASRRSRRVPYPIVAVQHELQRGQHGERDASADLHAGPRFQGCRATRAARASGEVGHAARRRCASPRRGAARCRGPDRAAPGPFQMNSRNTDGGWCTRRAAGRRRGRRGASRRPDPKPKGFARSPSGPGFYKGAYDAVGETLSGYRDARRRPRGTRRGSPRRPRPQPPYRRIGDAAGGMWDAGRDAVARPSTRPRGRNRRQASGAWEGWQATRTPTPRAALAGDRARHGQAGRREALGAKARARCPAKAGGCRRVYKIPTRRREEEAQGEGRGRGRRRARGRSRQGGQKKVRPSGGEEEEGRRLHRWDEEDPEAGQPRSGRAPARQGRGSATPATPPREHPRAAARSRTSCATTPTSRATGTTPAASGTRGSAHHANGIADVYGTGGRLAGRPSTPTSAARARGAFNRVRARHRHEPRRQPQRPLARPSAHGRRPLRALPTVLPRRRYRPRCCFGLDRAGPPRPPRRRARDRGRAGLLAAPGRRPRGGRPRAAPLRRRDPEAPPALSTSSVTTTGRPRGSSPPSRSRCGASTAGPLLAALGDVATHGRFPVDRASPPRNPRPRRRAQRPGPPPRSARDDDDPQVRRAAACSSRGGLLAPTPHAPDGARRDEPLPARRAAARRPFAAPSGA